MAKDTKDPIRFVFDNENDITITPNGKVYCGSMAATLQTDCELYKDNNICEGCPLTKISAIIAINHRVMRCSNMTHEEYLLKRASIERQIEQLKMELDDNYSPDYPYLMVKRNAINALSNYLDTLDHEFFAH